MELSNEKLVDLFHARARRRFLRGLKRKHLTLIKRLTKAKEEAPSHEKPDVVKTHLRNMIITPKMIGSMVGVYNGKVFNSVEIKVFFLKSLKLILSQTNIFLKKIQKPEMVGHYLGEFSITYKPVKHGRPGIGATHSSRFIPLK